MSSLFDRPSPEELFRLATTQEGMTLSGKDMALLKSGYEALKAYQKPINRIEKRAIKALILSIAEQKKINESSLHYMLSSKFGFEKVDKMPARQWQSVMDFLVSLQEEVE